MFAPTIAIELGRKGIRVNSIHPNAIATPMVMNEALYKLGRPDLEHPSYEGSTVAFAQMNPMGVGFMDPIHVSNAVLFLASDEAVYVNGVELSVDAGAMLL